MGGARPGHSRLGLEALQTVSAGCLYRALPKRDRRSRRASRVDGRRALKKSARFWPSWREKPEVRLPATSVRLIAVRWPATDPLCRWRWSDNSRSESAQQEQRTPLGLRAEGQHPHRFPADFAQRFTELREVVALAAARQEAARTSVG